MLVLPIRRNQVSVHFSCAPPCSFPFCIRFLEHSISVRRPVPASIERLLPIPAGYPKNFLPSAIHPYPDRHSPPSPPPGPPSHSSSPHPVHPPQSSAILYGCRFPSQNVPPR